MKRTIRDFNGYALRLIYIVCLIKLTSLHDFVILKIGIGP